MSKLTLVDRLFNSYVAGRPLPIMAGGDGNATPTPTPTASPTPTPTPEPAPDLGKLVADAIAKAGDPNAALKSLVADNHALRDDLKAAKARLPKDGAVILGDDEAKDWAAFRQLGKPSDLRKSLDEGNQYKTKALGYEREKHHNEVATVAGMKAPVLDRLATTDNLTLVIRDEEDPKTKKPVKVAHVVTEAAAEGKEAKTRPLAEYAAERWADFLPALKGTAETPKPVPNGTPAANAFRPAPRPAITPEGATHRRRTNVF